MSYVSYMSYMSYMSYAWYIVVLRGTSWDTRDFVLQWLPPRPWDHVPCGVASSIGPQSADLQADPPGCFLLSFSYIDCRFPSFRFVT